MTPSRLIASRMTADLKKALDLDRSHVLRTRERSRPPPHHPGQLLPCPVRAWRATVGIKSALPPSGPDPGNRSSYVLLSAGCGYKRKRPQRGGGPGPLCRRRNWGLGLAALCNAVSLNLFQAPKFSELSRFWNGVQSARVIFCGATTMGAAMLELMALVSAVTPAGSGSCIRAQSRPRPASPSQGTSPFTLQSGP
jgi:hypothetical protein